MDDPAFKLKKFAKTKWDRYMEQQLRPFMKDKVYILGGFQTDFARNFHREGKDISQLLGETLSGGLESVAVDPSFIETVHIGNFIGELTTGQAHLGGFVSEMIPAFNSIPCARHEAACASGGVALLAAMSDILSGRYRTAAVAGLEMEKNISGDAVAAHLGAAAWVERECQGVKYPWPALFDEVGEIYSERYGLERDHLTAIARSHFANARRNPNAQTRRWEMPERSFSQEEEFNPVVTGRIRRSDCSQITDGGAMVILAGAEAARDYADRHRLSIGDIPCFRGWGHTTGPMTLESKRRLSEGRSYIFPHLKKCWDQTLQRAGMDNTFALDAIETHDCFTTSAYMAIDHLGITPAGDNGRAIEEGWIFEGGRLPVNPSGGLIGGGHPVGATGVRMVLDGFKQVTGRAGDYQVEDCRNIGTLNIGGSVTTCVSFIIGKNEES